MELKLQMFFSIGVTCWSNSDQKYFHQIVYMWKDHSNQACTTQRYVKSCDLIIGGSGVTSCSYQCPCKDNQCQVVVVDDKQQFEKQPANICEITYELTE